MADKRDEPDEIGSRNRVTNGLWTLEKVCIQKRKKS